MSFLERAMEIRGEGLQTAPGHRDANRLLDVIVDVYHVKDLDTLLERVLLEARKFVNADAGTLYLKAVNWLQFSYVQNDSLSRGDAEETSYQYSKTQLPIDRQSLAGYVAATGDSILIDDVYDIRSSITYSFNPDSDTRTSYRTTSMLIVPLVTRSNVILGVLQLINAKDTTGKIVPFSGQDRLYITHFAQNAANAIEKAKLNREMVLRMVEISELRDPFETSQHAKRVGSYAVELYDKWAVSTGIPQAEIRSTREILRTAAMLHDVGKVAISDAILKKATDLTGSERDRMQMHTIFGARLFKHSDSPWDRMAMDVALNHHENWDGSGYPGKADNIFSEKLKFGPGLAGNEIPIHARVVSIADVYDSLISRRAYKDPWEDKQVIEYLEWQAGKMFDPELVEIFLGMQDIVKTIRRKFSY